MANINKKLGKRIKALRRARKVTQEDLAYEAKIDYSYLNEIEAGKRNPSIKRIAAIAKVLKISISDLLK